MSLPGARDEELLDELLVYLERVATALAVTPPQLEGSPLAQAGDNLAKALLRAQWLNEAHGVGRGPAAVLQQTLDEALLALEAAATQPARALFHSALFRCQALVQQAHAAAEALYADLPEPLERDELW